MKKAVVLFSGGVESSAILYLYLSRGWIVYPVYVKTGQFWERFEYRKAIHLWEHTRKRYPNLMPLRVEPLRAVCPRPRSINTESQLFIPLRNLTLLTAVGNYALSKGAYQIGLGSLGLYPFPDNNLGYIKQVEDLMSKGASTKIEVDVPLLGLEKSEVVRRFKNLVPFHLTFSCVNPVIKDGRILHCGKCIKCMERKEAMAQAF